jgi:hypothetical protein
MRHATSYPFHAEWTETIAAPPERVFALLDDHRRLSSHMTQSSWMMAGSSMSVRTDPGQGRAIGSKISLDGKVLGMRLNVDEIVTEREPPTRKTWATVGTPRLLVIGSYVMGFEISAEGGGSVVRVWINYGLPESAVARWLGRLFGKLYAKWCTTRMASDAAKHFRK